MIAWLFFFFRERGVRRLAPARTAAQAQGVLARRPFLVRRAHILLHEEEIAGSFGERPDDPVLRDRVALRTAKGAAPGVKRRDQEGLTLWLLGRGIQAHRPLVREARPRCPGRANIRPNCPTGSTCKQAAGRQRRLSGTGARPTLPTTGADPLSACPDSRRSVSPRGWWFC